MMKLEMRYIKDTRAFSIIEVIIVFVIVVAVTVIVFSALKKSAGNEKQNMSNRAVSIDFEVINEDGVRVKGSVPYAYQFEDKSTRLYFCGNRGIQSAFSGDGVIFNEDPLSGFSGEQGIACDATVVKLDDGRYRMYYKQASGPGGPDRSVHSVASATSNDGVNWQPEQGLRIDSTTSVDKGFASVPEVIVLPDGRIRLYYVSANQELANTGFKANGIAAAISNNGIDFKPEKMDVIKGYVDPAIIKLNNDTYLLVAALIFPTGNQQMGLYVFTSQDGLNFSDPKQIIANDHIFDPALAKVSDSTFRIYYGSDEAGEYDQIKSLLIKIK